MIRYKGHTISAEFAGIGRPDEHVVRRVSACGTVGVALVGTFTSVDDAKAAIDSICTTCGGTGTAGGHRCTQLECCGPCEACDGTGRAVQRMCLAGATGADGSSFYLCDLPEGHSGPHAYPSPGARRSA